VPKSLDPVARGRQLPVPDDRPSEKIAKLFPQTAPLKDPSREQKGTTKPPEVTSATNARPAAQLAPSASAAPQAPAVQAAVTKPVPLPEPRPQVEAASAKPHPRHLRRYRHRR
jgi:membrane-bound lytic murein transglycosylase A